MLFVEEWATKARLPDPYLNSRTYRHAYAGMVATTISEKCPALTLVTFKRIPHRDIGTDRITLKPDQQQQVTALDWFERS